MFARPALMNLPFFIAGTLKIVYDVVLYKQFGGATAGGDSVERSMTESAPRVDGIEGT